jgi:hypothetical protein
MRATLILIITTLAISLGVNAQQWEDVGSSFSNGQGFSPSILFYNSTPYVAYSEQNTTGSSFKASVKKYNGTGWEYVGTPGFSAWRANDVSMDINLTTGEPYVAYQDMASGAEKTTVMKFNGTSWVNVGAPTFSGGTIAREQCIKIDGLNGMPYVAMRYKGTGSSAPYEIKVMKFDGTNWVNVGSGIIAGVTGATGISMAIDNGTPYVTCLNASQSDATSVFKFNGTAWVSVGSLTVSAGAADHQSIAVYNGTPYVAYRDLANSNKTTVRKFNGTSWVNVGTVGFSANQAQFQSIAIDNSGIPFVAYSDNSNFGGGGQTTVMQFDGTNWVNTGSASFTTVNSAFQDLAIDNGTPYVTYMDGGNLRITAKAFLPCILDVPDVNLMQALLSDNAINTNNNLFIECTEAAAYSGTLFLGSLNITDATGLEAFTNATGLQIQGNSGLTTLDLSSNTALESISCTANGLTTLTIGTNNALEELFAENNSLTALNVSGAVNLLKLMISNMPSLSGMDLSANTELLELDCSGSTSIGGSGIIKEIDFSQNTQLTTLNVSNCGLTIVDVSANSNLTSLACDGNSLEYLNVANGNNANMGTMLNLALDARNNSGLTCIQVDNGFTPTTPDWEKDPGASYSIACTPLCYVTIPDPSFKAYLVGNGSINTNGDTEIQCSEASAYTEDFQLFNLNISDLTGIEAFTALTELFFSNNNVTTLDLSANLSLTHLRSSQNPISLLDLSNNTALTFLECQSNALSTLDLTNNISLTTLKVDNNTLGNLDVANQGALTSFSCSNNALTSLNLANGNNINLFQIQANNNPNLTCIEVDDESYSTTNWVGNSYTFDAQASFSTNCNSTILVSSITVQGQGGASTITTAGGTLLMEATVLPANADDATYTWSVMDGSGSASIDANGLLTAITDGTVSVIANANDASGIAGTATITISNQTAGINEKEVAELVKVYPNPVSSHLFVNIEGGQINHLEIVDYAGRVVKTIAVKNSKGVDVSDLNEGVYILKVSSENGIFIRRFIKQ